MMTTWEEMTVLEQMQCQYWDMFKDAYNYRPRGIDTTTWTEAMFMAEFETLARVIEENEVQRIRSEELAVARFEEQIRSVIADGAGDRETAIRWFHESEGSNGDDDYLCFLLGLPYGYIKTPKV